MRYASWKDRKAIAAALRPIYTAATAEAAEQALAEFAGSQLGRRCPAVVDVWRRAWTEFVPFPPDLRKVVYTTDEIVKRGLVASVASARRGLRRRITGRSRVVYSKCSGRRLWRGVVRMWRALCSPGHGRRVLPLFASRPASTRGRQRRVAAHG
jgi:Transposase, Mutator family